MGASLRIALHKKLCTAKSTKEDVIFCGVNIIVLGDLTILPILYPRLLHDEFQILALLDATMINQANYQIQL